MRLASAPLRKRIIVGIARIPRLAGGVRVGVDVHLHDLEVVAISGDLLEDRGDDPARPAPGGPEVDEHGLVGLEDLGLETGVGDFFEIAGHLRSLLLFAYFRKYSGRVQPASASKRRGETQVSTAAAATRTGTAIATVTNVAASRSFHAPRREAMVHAASGRNSAVSSGRACGSRPTISRAGDRCSSPARSDGAVAERVRLGAERERRRQDHEADRQRAGLVVDLAHDAAVALGDGGQRRPGHEAGDAGERVQREHQAVAVEDEAEVGGGRLVRHAGELHAARDRAS